MLETEEGRRIKILYFIVLLVIGFLIVRLAWLQLLQGTQYKKIADQNRIRQQIIQAPRGTIYDRNGAILVANRPSFAISVLPSDYTNPAKETPLLAEITGVSAEEIEKMIAAGAEFPYQPVRIRRDADEAMLAKISERKSYLPGVVTEAVPVRQYLYKTLAAQVLGYVGIISEEEYAKHKNQGYLPTDLIGKDGLEYVWESWLRGVDGGQQVEVNAAGEEVGIIGTRPPVPGRGIVLTLDANLQKVAEEALDSQIKKDRNAGIPAKGGAVIVLDTHSGAVLAMASAPSFDPNLFASGISSLDWNALISNPDTPLTNRAIQNMYPPGSVFKIVTASAALDTGCTTPSEIFVDKGVYYLAGWQFFGWDPKGLGRLNLADAITWSSDPVFYELGRRLGVDRLASYALTFGLGQKTGIHLPGEVAGNVPTEEWKLKTYGEPWYPGESLIAAIGQGYYLTTPLQQAMLLMTVANGGIQYKPRLVDKILKQDGSTYQSFPPEVLRTVYLKPEYWDTIRQGLKGVVSQGTATSVFQGYPGTLAGKTGSAETGTGTTHSWFSCYAPAENPKIAVTAFVEDGEDGSVSAAPIVRTVLEAYFGFRKNSPPDVRQPGKSD
ncbi:Hypothetical protein LUCI_4119 [Lucifera butyrica]|uniref:Penicillin-binding protein 2 n=1 Tax=Lucifera butyrica TaxID=1351585 RepID=A0A498RIA9_9FIRM|nr:penicillin-binding protein 2 [Lucifera butyrica]VBB08838.1 Hypothetical protein LUCI_4119 [Lucifera butyrica]